MKNMRRRKKLITGRLVSTAAYLLFTVVFLISVIAYDVNYVAASEGSAEIEKTAKPKSSLVEVPFPDMTEVLEEVSDLHQKAVIASVSNRAFMGAITAAVKKPMVFAQSSDLNMEIYEGENKPFDPYTKRTSAEVQQMLEYAKWWRTQNISYGTSWVKKGSKYYDGSKSFHNLKPNGKSDCSWFVYNILHKFGYVKKFISSTKWGEDPSQYPGAKVVGNTLNKARPGDVICSGKAELGKAHVALYVGDGYVIECTFSGVKLTKASHKVRRVVHFSCNP